MIKDEIEALVVEAVRSAAATGLLVGGDCLQALPTAVRLTRPRLSAHGDLALSVGRLGSAIGCKLQAERLAQILSEQIGSICARRPGLTTAVFFSAPAFVGFKIDAAVAARSVSAIIAQGILPATQTKAFVAPAERAALVKTERFLRLAVSERINILTGTIEPPLLSGRVWLSLLNQWQNDSVLFEVLFREESASRGPALDLVWQLAELKALDLNKSADLSVPDLHNAANRLISRRLAALAQALLCFFSHFEGDQGFFNCDLSVLKARLGLIFACKQVLSERLGIMDLSISSGLA